MKKTVIAIMIVGILLGATFAVCAEAQAGILKKIVNRFRSSFNFKRASKLASQGKNLRAAARGLKGVRLALKARSGGLFSGRSLLGNRRPVLRTLGTLAGLSLAKRTLGGRGSGLGLGTKLAGAAIIAGGLGALVLARQAKKKVRRTAILGGLAIAGGLIALNRIKKKARRTALLGGLALTAGLLLRRGGRKPLGKLLLLGLGIAAVAVVAGVIGMKFGENKAKAEMYDQMMAQMGAAAEEMPLGSISGQIREESQRLLGLSGIEVQVAGEVQVPVESSSGGCSDGSCGTSSGQQYETQYVEANDVTGFNGKYKIDELPYGVYQLLITSKKHMWICQAEIEIDDDVTMDFSIPQLSLISGYVTGPLGIMPLSGIGIDIGPADNQAHAYDIDQDGEDEYYLESCIGNVCHYTQAIFQETTDANGYFEVYAPVGDYQITAFTADKQYQPQVQVVTVGAGQIEPVSFSLNLWQPD